MSDTFLVFFEDQNCDLSKAIASLEKYSFIVENNNNSLLAAQGEFVFDITLSRENHVLEEAKEIGLETEYSQEMSLCNSRFEVQVTDLDEALDEMNTLIDIQFALQKASKGYLFVCWSDSLTAPYTN